MFGVNMAWERGAWEKRTSNGASYVNTDTSYNENINSSSPVRETSTGGLSFCPKCRSMMINRNGVLKCSKCGYSEYGMGSSRNVGSSRNIPTKSRFEQKQSRNQMNNVLRVMRQGKTRSQAAYILDIPLSRINQWYHDGMLGLNKHVSHFYREVNYIEEDRERRKREEINRRNRIERENRERKVRQEREKRKRQERLRKQESDKNIRKQMNSIVTQMKKGKSRQQAANFVGVSRSTVNGWYNKGRNTSDEPYKSFYTQVKRIETSHKTTKSNYNVEEKMEKVLSLMRTGLSRNDAAQKAGVNILKVNNWYDKGKNGDATYINFYNKVNNIENTRNKYKQTSKPKTYTKSKITTQTKNKSKSKSNTKNKTPTRHSNLVTCSKCGKKYNKKYNIECPHCKKTTSAPKTPTNDDSSDWAICCILLIIVFMVFAFLGLLNFNH
jgi:transposase-like protein